MTSTIPAITAPIKIKADGSDQTTVLQTYVNADIIVGGLTQLPKGTIGIVKPIVKPNFHRLAGINARGGATTISLLGSWPNSTVAVGVTTPAARTTDFTIQLSGTVPAGFILPSGGGVVFVQAEQFIPVTFSGTSGSTLTGCRTAYPSLPISIGAVVGCPAIIDVDPISGNSAFGSSIEHLEIACNSIPGSGGYYTDTANELAGPIETFVADAMGIGICFNDNSRGLGASSTQNCRMQGFTVRLGATAPSAAVNVSVMTNSTELRDIADFTLNVSTLVDKAAVGLRLDGCTVNVHDWHTEHVATAIQVGKYKACGQVQIVNGNMSQQASQLGIIRYNSHGFNVFNIQNTSGAGNTIDDRVTGKVLTDANIDMYFDLGTKGIITDSAAVNAPWGVGSPSQIEAYPIGGVGYATIPTTRVNNTFTPTSGTLALFGLGLPAGFVVSKLAFRTGGIGVSFATSNDGHWYLVIYDQAGNLVASTADQGITGLALSSNYDLALARDSANNPITSWTVPTNLNYLAGMMLYLGSSGGTPAAPNINAGPALSVGSVQQIITGQPKVNVVAGTGLTTGVPPTSVTYTVAGSNSPFIIAH